MQSILVSITCAPLVIQSNHDNPVPLTCNSEGFDTLDLREAKAFLTEEVIEGRLAPDDLDGARAALRAWSDRRRESGEA